MTSSYVCLCFVLLGFRCGVGKMNVLFLVSDDLRPQIGAYATKSYPPYVAPEMHTPNLDSLASRSLLLERAYVQQALCGPSRASLLTGRRPDTTHVYKCGEYFRSNGGNFTTIPQYFKMNGYRSVGMGKIFHSKGVHTKGDDPISWSEPYFHGVPNFENVKTSWAAIPDQELKSKPLLDEQIANHSIYTMRRLVAEAEVGKQPFFLAVGFRRPHLPFVFPKSFLQYYPRIKLPDNPYAPVGMPEVAWRRFKRLIHYLDVDDKGGANINTTLPFNTVLSLRRAYYCSVTWVDSLIGRILQELDTLKIAQNTIVSFIGDHGFQLGEHGSWGKHTNFELSTHAPMMIHIPGKSNKGIRSDALVEFVDLFPTLVEAAGLDPLPLCPKNSVHIQLCREGVSLIPLLNVRNKNLRKAAFSQHNRKEFMGYSLRTNRYRYTEWPRFRYKPAFKPIWFKPGAGVELYDHLVDPKENVNRAFDLKYEQTRIELSKMLRNGWRDSIIYSETLLYRYTNTSDEQLSAAFQQKSLSFLLYYITIYILIVVSLVFIIIRQSRKLFLAK